MGTAVSVVTEAAAADQAADEVRRLFAEWEQRLSRFRLGARAGAEFLEHKRLAGLLVAWSGAWRRGGSWTAPSAGRREASWSPASR